MQALVVLGLSLIHFAAGHGALWFPVPREGRVAVASRTVGSYPTNDPAVLQGCGTGVKTDQDGEPSWRNTFLQGSFINVEWHVEKPHPAVGGWDEKIRIALKPLGSGSFADHILLANSTNDISGSLALNETRLRKGEVQVRIQLPDEPNCTKCIFQWIWDSEHSGASYVSCALIKILPRPEKAPHVRPSTLFEVVGTYDTRTNSSSCEARLECPPGQPYSSYQERTYWALLNAFRADPPAFEQHYLAPRALPAMCDRFRNVQAGRQPFLWAGLLNTAARFHAASLADFDYWVQPYRARTPAPACGNFVDQWGQMDCDFDARLNLLLNATGLVACDSYDGRAGSTRCAREWSNCSCPGHKVEFGAQEWGQAPVFNRSISTLSDGVVPCNFRYLGDPYPGVPKECRCQDGTAERARDPFQQFARDVQMCQDISVYDMYDSRCQYGAVGVSFDAADPSIAYYSVAMAWRRGEETNFVSNAIAGGGSHIKWGDYVRFFATYDWPESVPSSAVVYIDGVAYPLSQTGAIPEVFGAKPRTSTWSIDLVMGSACATYFFVFTNVRARFRFPEQGAFKTYGIGNCTEEFTSEENSMVLDPYSVVNFTVTGWDETVQWDITEWRWRLERQWENDHNRLDLRLVMLYSEQLDNTTGTLVFYAYNPRPYRTLSGADWVAYLTADKTQMRRDLGLLRGGFKVGFEVVAAPATGVAEPAPNLFPMVLVVGGPILAVATLLGLGLCVRKQPAWASRVQEPFRRFSWLTTMYILSLLAAGLWVLLLSVFFAKTWAKSADYSSVSLRTVCFALPGQPASCQALEDFSAVGAAAVPAIWVLGNLGLAAGFFSWAPFLPFVLVLELWKHNVTREWQSVLASVMLYTGVLSYTCFFALTWVWLLYFFEVFKDKTIPDSFAYAPAGPFYLTLLGALLGAAWTCLATGQRERQPDSAVMDAGMRELFGSGPVSDAPPPVPAKPPHYQPAALKADGRLDSKGNLIGAPPAAANTANTAETRVAAVSNGPRGPPPGRGGPPPGPPPGPSFSERPIRPPSGLNLRQ